jgi:hypothetical protein
MGLQLIRLLRDEKKLDGFPDLIAQIHTDVQDTKNLLDNIPHQQLQSNDFLAVPSSWLGSSGGDEMVNWEFAPMT